MDKGTVVVEQAYSAPIARVWSALTEKDRMKQWYFDIAEFRPERGFEFRFVAGTEEKKWLHICKITEVIPGKRLRHSWRYDGITGISYVTFELFDEGKGTRLRLTHSGLETFPTEPPDFTEESFSKGWTYLTGTSLKDYLDSVHGRSSPAGDSAA